MFQAPQSSDSQLRVADIGIDSGPTPSAATADS